MANELAIMTTGGTIQPYDGDRLPAVQQLGAMLAKSGYFADAREAAQAAVKVMAGEELGIAPVAAMMGINIIKGKVALSANLMAAQVRRHGYNYRIKSITDKGCVLEFIGKDKASIGESSFNEEDAKAAKVWASDKDSMYQKYPRNMYFSRAMSNGVKWFCPEVTSGLPIYTAEELGERVNGEGEMIHPEETRGSQAAADAVADRKIAEMQQKQAAPAGKSKDYGMLDAFGKMKKDIGEKNYYIFLGNNGYEHANEITDVSKARSIYAEMAGYLKSQRAQQDRPPRGFDENEAQAAVAMAESAEDVWGEGRE